MDRFGSLAAFAGADFAELRLALPSIPGLPRALVAAQSIAMAGIRERAHTSKVVAEDRSFLDYLRLRMASRETELLLGFFASADGTLICERVLAESRGHAITVSAGAILRAAVGVGAAAVLLVHNHPSGDALPSRADRAAMRTLTTRSDALDIRIIDHLIVGGWNVFSMGQERRL